MSFRAGLLTPLAQDLAVLREQCERAKGSAVRAAGVPKRAAHGGELGDPESARGKKGLEDLGMETKEAKTGMLERARVILAITGKDSLDAVRNRTLLSVLVAVVVMIALFRVLPSLRGEDNAILVVVDPSQSAVVDRWAEGGQFDLHRTVSRQEMEDILGGEETALLGLVLPTDLDQQLARDSGLPITLQGYVDHWVSDTEADEMQATTEAQLTALTGRPVRIEVSNEAVFSHPRGLRPVTTSFLMVYALVVVGLMIAPNLMIEEKELKTMEALLISPASPGQIVVAKALTGLLYCLLAGGLVLAASAAAVVHWEVALLAVLSGSLFAVSLGLLLGVILGARQQLIIWSSVLMFPLFVPVIVSEVLADLQAPALVEEAVSLVPTVPVAEATRWALSGQLPWGDVSAGLAVTLAWALPLLAVVAWIVRRSDR